MSFWIFLIYRLNTSRIYQDQNKYLNHIFNLCSSYAETLTDKNLTDSYILTALVDISQCRHLTEQ